MNSITVQSEDLELKRLDCIVKKYFLPLLSRSQISQVIKQGNIFVNKAVNTKPSYSIKINDLISITSDYNSPIKKTQTTRDSLPKVDIEFENNHLAVINKEPNTVVHAGSGNDTNTLVDALIEKYGVNGLSSARGKHESGIVHRLDKDTSGLMLIAKNDIGFESLSKQIKEKTCSRVYYCICIGKPMPLSDTIENYIVSHPKNRTKYFVTKEPDKHDKPKLASMDYKVVKILGKGQFSLVEVKLHTGRKHQIRVQLNNLGYAIVGDRQYTNKSASSFKRLTEENKKIAANAPRQMLHSKTLSFKNPESGEIITIESDIPNDMKKIIRDIDN